MRFACTAPQVEEDFPIGRPRGTIWDGLNRAPTKCTCAGLLTPRTSECDVMRKQGLPGVTSQEAA